MSAWTKKLLTVAVTLAAGAASASPVTALSYDMINGDGQAHGGTYNYWDRNYSGSGSTTTDAAALSGGLGKLTDGVVATTRWETVSNSAGTGQYVGWLSTSAANPTITFHFAPGAFIDSISIQLDNSGFGGVYAPAQILIDGVSETFTAPALGSVGTVSFANLGLTGSTHTVQFVQQRNTWTFVSEISFDGSSNRVPEPASLALAGLGLALLARRSRR